MVVLDHRGDMSYPQPVDDQHGDVIIVRSRNAEMKLMHDSNGTCLPAFFGDRRFSRIVAYSYVPVAASSS